MSATICLWATLLVLLQGVVASTGIVNLFTSLGCTGSHLSCGNVPAGGCCTTGGVVVASVFVVTAENHASVSIHADPDCKGVSRKAGALSCFQPSFAFAAANWASPSARRDEEQDSTTDSSDCRRPDTIIIVDENGQESKIRIPDGENTEYEKAFVKGDYDKLREMDKGKRYLRFSR